MGKRAKNAGFSLIEAVISVVLLSVMLGSLVMAIDQGMGLFSQTTASGDVEARAGRGLDRLTRELVSASMGSLAPNLNTQFGQPTIWTSTLDYRTAIGWAGGTQLGTTMRIALELEDGEVDNGVDDNNNGLVDERQVVRIENPGPNEQRVVLVNGVSELLEGELPNGADDNGNNVIDERGLCFDLDGDTLNIRLSVERIGPDGNLIVRTQVASLALRN